MNKIFGFYVIPCVKKSPHYFGGSSEIIGLICPNCKRQIPPFLTITVNEIIRSKLKINSKALKQIPLFYCWTCELDFNPGIYPVYFYEIIENNTIKFIQYPGGNYSPDFPYDNYPSVFPLIYADLLPIPENDKNLMENYFFGKVDYNEIVDNNIHLLTNSIKIFDTPYLLNYEELIKKLGCPRCGKEMIYFCTLTDLRNPEIQFVGDLSVFMIFHFCSDCGVIGYYHVYS